MNFEQFINNVFGASLQQFEATAFEIMVIVITSALAIKSLVWIVKWGVSWFKYLTIHETNDFGGESWEEAYKNGYR